MLCRLVRAWQGMDPHQRVVLEVGYEALHGAGYTKGKMMNKVGASLRVGSTASCAAIQPDLYTWKPSCLRRRLLGQQHVPRLSSRRVADTSCCLKKVCFRTIFGMVSEVSGATGGAASINSNRFSFCYLACASVRFA